MAKVLVVDDNAALRALLRTQLERGGHEVLEAEDGLAGVRQLYSARPDLVVLDVAMPRMDGWATLQRVRELSEVPVLMLSAVAGEQERVRGLLSGADDFLSKPFSGPELLARIVALLRRGSRGEVVEVVEDERARVDAARHEAVVDGVRLKLTPLEFRLLGTFLRHHGAALSHEQLLEHAWQGHHGSREQVKVAVLALRRKLRAASPGAEEAIQTVRGVGYRWQGSGVPVAS
jgi:DNA-binding response OmpR family regulator